MKVPYYKHYGEETCRISKTSKKVEKIMTIASHLCEEFLRSNNTARNISRYPETRTKCNLF